MAVFSYVVWLCIVWLLYLSVYWRLSARIILPRHICLTGHQNGIADPSILGDDEKVCL